MDDSVLWAVALSSGVLGLLLLAVAGAAAAHWKVGARRARDVDSADKSQPHTRNVASTDTTGSPANSSAAQRTAAGGPWAWIKAWVFALLHAGIVSLVLGGITFFEDLAKASDEIQSTGTVSFPKQLLPGTLSGPVSRKRLPQPSEDSSRSDDYHSDERPGEETGGDVEVKDTGQSAAPPPDAVGWEVVDLISEVGAGRDG